MTQTNAVDPKQIKEAKITSKDLRKQELRDVSFLLSSVEGRRFFYRYLVMSKVFETTMTGSSYTFFNEGMRNIGLSLMADLNEADPSAYSKIIEENRKA
jgi:hypothetical protein